MLAALAGAGPAAAAPREFFGLVPQNTPTTADIQRMGQGRVGTVRLLLNWGAVEPVDDQFNWAAVDSYVGDLAAAGIQPYPFVWGVPPYVTQPTKRLPVGSPVQEAQWQEFLREAVKRYGPGGQYWTTVFPAQHPGAQALSFKVWQVWNEQNAPKHVQPLSPASYARLLEISHSAITSQDPGAEIVLGGMFGAPTGPGGIKASRFLKGLYKVDGVRNNFDGISLHPYARDLGGVKEQVNRVRKVLKKNKDKKADMWVTEIGWGGSSSTRTPRVKSLKGQAKLLKKMFKLFAKNRKKWRVGGVMWYTWRDLQVQSSPCDWCTSAGLFGQSGSTPKPAWRAFVRFTDGS